MPGPANTRIKPGLPIQFRTESLDIFRIAHSRTKNAIAASLDKQSYLLYAGRHFDQTNRRWMCQLSRVPCVRIGEAAIRSLKRDLYSIFDLIISARFNLRKNLVIRRALTKVRFKFVEAWTSTRHNTVNTTEPFFVSLQTNDAVAARTVKIIG